MGVARMTYKVLLAGKLFQDFVLVIRNSLCGILRRCVVCHAVGCNFLIYTQLCSLINYFYLLLNFDNQLVLQGWFNVGCLDFLFFACEAVCKTFKL